MTFLLLRPLAKCQASQAAFSAAGLDTVACALQDTQLNHQAIARLPNDIQRLRADSLVIITSTVAAEECVRYATLWPPHCQFFAVGASTAKILLAHGLQVIVPEQARSEGLLALAALQQVNKRQIVIIKGFGGRDLLAETLNRRGAEVQEWDLYQRINLASPSSTRHWHKEQIQCIIATSGEVIEAAFAYFPAAWLSALRWIVVSQRTAQIAAKLGVKQLLVSANASDDMLIASALQVQSNSAIFLEY
jgi:uroporphyrinogen-III synthase